MAGRFAHLLGLGRPAANKSAGKPDDQRDDETDEEYADRKKREEDEDNNEEEDKKGKKARAEDGGDEDEDGEPKKGKKAGRAEDGDDDDAEMSEDDDDEDEDDKKDKGDAKANSARKRERARCAAIFASKHAASRPDMAAHLAFETGMGRRAACAMLRTAANGSTAQRGLSSRMNGMQQLRPGADGPTGKPNIKGSWDAAAERAGLVRK